MFCAQKFSLKQKQIKKEQMLLQSEVIQVLVYGRQAKYTEWKALRIKRQLADLLFELHKFLCCFLSKTVSLHFSFKWGSAYRALLDLSTTGRTNQMEL